MNPHEQENWETELNLTIALRTYSIENIAQFSISFSSMYIQGFQQSSVSKRVIALPE